MTNYSVVHLEEEVQKKIPLTTKLSFSNKILISGLNVEMKASLVSCINWSKEVIFFLTVILHEEFIPLTKCCREQTG